MGRCLLLVCGLAVSVAAHASGTPDERLNIVLLYADDWRHDTLGVAGNPVAQTPRLDRLARDGIRFTHNYVTTSICGISRASLFTGQWMSRHGCRDFGPWETPWSETYPGLLRDHGYHVGHVGKWHNGAVPEERFDFCRCYHGSHWYESENGDPAHVTQHNESDAIEFLRTRPREKPFCLTVAFFAPHAEDRHPDQYLPQPRSARLYEGTTIPTPPTATEDSWRRLPSFFDERNEGRKRWRRRFDTPKKYQTMMKNYYRLATEVDAACGRVGDELERQGVLDDTLVIFTTDNGYFHGEHGLADKWYPYEESIRVPLIVRDPRLPEPQRGATRDDLILNVDLAPTILVAAGVDPPGGMQGRDISRRYLGGAEPAWRSEFFYEHPTIRDVHRIPTSEALVSKHWKYVRWPDHDVEQLFDLAADPREENDLVGDPAHATSLADMRHRFARQKKAAR